MLRTRHRRAACRFVPNSQSPNSVGMIALALSVG
jgi:hypothetical protein